MERSFWLTSSAQTDDERRHALAHELGVPFVRLEPREITLEAMLIIPEPLAREHNAVAYALRGHELEVALLDLAQLEQLHFLESRYRLLPRLTTRAGMVQALLHYQKHLRNTYGQALEQGDAAHLLETLLKHALMSGASDIHLDQHERGLSVRYRIRGSLKEALALSPLAASNLFNTLRTIVGPGSMPRERALRVDLGSGEDVGVRVSALPTLQGERMVLHLVREKARRGWTLATLGLHGGALERVHDFLNRRRGLLVVEGAEGAGKTTMLYTMLDLLNTPELSLASVEERVAQVLPRAAQVEVGGGVSAAAALRGVLKGDPDVVMVDPLQGGEATKVAEAAAGRGVLVLAGSEEAKEERGLPAGRQGAILAIRVATLKKLCDKKFLDKKKLTRQEGDALERAGADFAKVLAALKAEEKVSKEQAWKDMQFARAAGCSECNMGYTGMLGVQEVVEKGETVDLNLIEDALFKAAQGLTSIEEVLSLAAKQG